MKGQKELGFRRAGLVGLLIAASLTSAATRAQIPVYDAANFSQNILTAIRTLQSNVNEVQQIAHQIEQINHEIQNLERIPGAITAGLLADYTVAWTQMTNTFAQINGLASNIGALTVTYNALYPQRGGAPLATPQVLAQLNRFLEEARKTYQGVYQTSGQVMASLPKAQQNLATTRASSTGASGNLDALQAQTQMTAQVAQLLVQQNAQIAAMNQAQADWLNQQMELMDNARVQQQQNAEWIPRTQPPAAYLPAIH